MAYPGYEYTYIFTAPYDGGVTVSLSDEEADTELIVLENMGDGCDPGQCIDWHLNQVNHTIAGASYACYYCIQHRLNHEVNHDDDWATKPEYRPAPRISESAPGELEHDPRSGRHSSCLGMFGRVWG